MKLVRFIEAKDTKNLSGPKYIDVDILKSMLEEDNNNFKDFDNEDHDDDDDGDNIDNDGNQIIEKDDLKDITNNLNSELS